MSGKANVYESVVAEIKRRIESGAVGFGEKLPSVRTYALEIRMNPNTVARAYAQLERERYIEVIPKKGAYVCLGGGAKAQGAAEQVVAQWFSSGVSKEEIEKAVLKYYGTGVEK
jgi:GntR family transcriptional regulator